MEPPYGLALRDSGSYVLRNYKDLCYHDGVLTQLKENVTTIGYDMVFFDYDMQIGDTLHVIEDVDSFTGSNEIHLLMGKIVKVTSIDTVEIQSSIRLKYNLESRFLSSMVGDNTDVGIPPGPDREEIYFYKILEIGEPFQESWIEGIGYTTEYYGTYTLQCVFEKGELIYCADGAKCNGLSEVANKKIDFSTLTLHRQGDMLMAVFPAAEPGEAITLYDASGRVVAKQAIRAGATTAGIDASSLPAGIYIATLAGGASAKVAL
ncbi:MAG: T9SS type A sorting domain-containing protein [Bacteroidaceae bacterium]|nr:T9SS type A sorting domain-containing protein [Bacteroidaceae bacterium]